MAEETPQSLTETELDRLLKQMRRERLAARKRRRAKGTHRAPMLVEVK